MAEMELSESFQMWKARIFDEYPEAVIHAGYKAAGVFEAAAFDGDKEKCLSLWPNSAVWVPRRDEFRRVEIDA